MYYTQTQHRVVYNRHVHRQIARVAQWQSVFLVRKRSRVRFPPRAPFSPRAYLSQAFFKIYILTIYNAKELLSSISNIQSHAKTYLI